jgi:hypothetical protein
MLEEKINLPAPELFKSEILSTLSPSLAGSDACDHVPVA